MQCEVEVPDDLRGFEEIIAAKINFVLGDADKASPEDYAMAHETAVAELRDELAMYEVLGQLATRPDSLAARLAHGD